MFVLVRVVQHFAATVPRRLLLLFGALAAAAGVALAGAGLATHQPIVTRFGIVVLVAIIAGLVAAKRARR
ncbi:MAG TPA: hypothetical protein VGM10_22840 [Actinocrinis sp.]|jgi:hypothetical protein